MRRNALTLIETLIIIVSIGVVVAIVIRNRGGKRTSELTAALQTDVRNAKAAESRYFATHGAYGTVAQLDSARLFSPVPGDSVTIVVAATGYTVTSKHPTGDLTCLLTLAGGEAGLSAARAVCK